MRAPARAACPLGWPADPGQAGLVEVVPLPAADPSADLAQLEKITAAARLLDGASGLHLARGSAVIDAIRAGEECGAAALAEAR